VSDAVALRDWLRANRPRARKAPRLPKKLLKKPARTAR
jgi:GrpB-like predicted nucleotidyltransferase (UPF0157 family)